MASYLQSSHWIVAVPDDTGSAKSKADGLRNAMVENTGKTLAEITPFDVPRTLKVGTLDSLMSLSDEVARADSFVEGVAKKVERQVAEAYHAEKAAELAKAGGDSISAVGPLRMYVPGGPNGKPIPVHEWAAGFRWDAGAWGDAQDPLPDILRRLLAAAEKIDADIRAYSQAYQERKSALQAAERKKSGNLMVAALEDIVTPDALRNAGTEWMSSESEYFQSVCVVVQKSTEEVFLSTYAELDGQSVPLGPEGRRDAVRGSPVVPGSAHRIAEDKDGYVLYTLVILKKFADSFRSACREKRFTVREFAFDPLQAGSVAKEVEERGKELALALAQLKTESRRKYGEVMQVWFHVKAVRVFVESVLRFGLPVNFAAALVRVYKDKNGPGGGGAEAAGKLLGAVKAYWKEITGGNSGMDDAYATGGKGDKAGAGADPVIPGVSEAGAAVGQPFVFFDFDIKPDTATMTK